MCSSVIMCMFPFENGYVSAPEGVHSWFLWVGQTSQVWPEVITSYDDMPYMYDKLDACFDMAQAFKNPDWVTPDFFEGWLVPAHVFPDSPAEEADPAGHFAQYEDLAP